MNRNIELKVRCSDLDTVRRLALELGAVESGLLRQRDTFFHAPDARLKLREVDGRGELIAYRRPDEPGAKTSQYLLFRTDSPASLVATLALALGTRGVVAKTRRLLLIRQTRIHLDEVERLGQFVELETVVADQSEEEARAQLQQIADALGLDRMQPVREAYVDLLR